jgi:hypothetical protein
LCFFLPHLLLQDFWMLYVGWAIKTTDEGSVTEKEKMKKCRRKTSSFEILFMPSMDANIPSCAGQIKEPKTIPSKIFILSHIELS